MTDVWVVRCPKGKVIGASTFSDRAIAEAQSGTINMDSRKALNETWNLYLDDYGEAGTYSCDGFTLTRETLLTSARAAVVEAAKAQLKAADALRTHSCILEICIHDKEHTRACIRVEDAVTALRALEGDA